MGCKRKKHPQETMGILLFTTFPQSIKGANLKQLIDQSQVLGFNARPLRLELNELKALKTPCILHWDLNHFVVLQKVSRQSIEILDPALGLRRVSFQEASKHFTGVALELTPQPNFKQTTQQPSFSLSQLTGHVQGLGASVLQILALAFVLEFFAILMPIFNQTVVDDVLTSGDHDLLTTLMWGFGLVLLIQSALFGLIPATNLIPNYRLSGTTNLPSISLKDTWTPAHEPIWKRLENGPIIDLRSKAYAELAPIPEDVEHFWVEVLDSTSGKALNHFNKKAKGQLVRAALTAKKAPETLTELKACAKRVGLSIEVSGNILTLVTREAT